MKNQKPRQEFDKVGLESKTNKTAAASNFSFLYLPQDADKLECGKLKHFLSRTISATSP